MSYVKFKGKFRSSNGENKVNYYIFEPETDLRAIIQFAHGWRDYIDRNEEIVDYFTNHGVMVCGCDFIGHGQNLGEEYGDFKKEEAWTYLMKDTRKLTKYIKSHYENVPLFLYGHGLGSLVARLCIMKENGYDGIILSGTSGHQRFCKRAMLVSSILKKVKGPSYRSSYIEKMILAKVNRKFLKEKDENAWECSNERHRFPNNLGRPDGFFYTMSAMTDMFKMLSIVSSGTWYHTVPEDLPLLLVSGKEDPLGSYGKGIMEIYKKLVKTNHVVNMKLYDGMRHNLQDEIDKESVFFDILSWMKEYIIEE